ncbi:hypothetical protein ACFL3F_02320 [Planctomycetota bacterium]
MSPTLCCAVGNSRWTAPRKTTGKHRSHRTRIGPVLPIVSKVERIRKELASGGYPLTSHLDAVLERLLNLLSHEND